MEAVRHRRIGGDRAAPVTGECANAALADRAGPRLPHRRGYFVGPAGSDAKGKYGPDDRPTALLLAAAQKSGQVPDIDEQTRTQALADLRFWNADVLVLPHTRNDRVLRETVRLLIGEPATPVDGVWVWDVRALTRESG